VLLGSVVSRSREGSAPVQNQDQLNEAEPNEPMAQLGVAPGGEESMNNSSDR